MAAVRKSRKLSWRWSREKEIAFLEHLALSSNVSASERVAKLAAGAAYRQRRKSPELAKAWDVALREGYGHLEESMLRRAIHGTPVTIIMKDGTKKETVEYSERLQMGLYNAHRATVLGPAAADAETARERLARKIAEVNRKLGPETAE